MDTYFTLHDITTMAVRTKILRQILRSRSKSAGLRSEDLDGATHSCQEQKLETLALHKCLLYSFQENK